MISCNYEISSFFTSTEGCFQIQVPNQPRNDINAWPKYIKHLSFHFWVHHQKLWKKKNSMYSCYRDAAKRKKTVCNVIILFCSKWLDFTFPSWLHLNFVILEFRFLVTVKIFSLPHFDLNNWSFCSHCDLWFALKA